MENFMDYSQYESQKTGYLKEDFRLFRIKDVICSDKEFIPFELRGVYFEITKNRNVVAHALESNFSSGKIIESLRTSLVTAGKYIN